MCFVCGPAENIEAVLGQGYSLSYGIVADLVLSLLVVVLVFNIVLRGIRLISASDARPFGQHLSDAFLFAFFASAISAASLVWEPLYNGLYNLGPHIGVITARQMGLEIQHSGMTGLLEAAETGLFGSVFRIFKSQMQDFYFLAAPMLSTAGMLLLLIVYGYFFWLIIKTVVMQVFQMYAIGFLGPIILGFCAFPETRNIGVHAIKILLTATAQLFLAAAALATVVSIMQGYIDALSPEEISKVSSAGSASYLQILFIGIVVNILYMSFVGVPSYLFQTFIQSAAQGGGMVGRIAGVAASAAGGPGAVAARAGAAALGR